MRARRPSSGTERSEKLPAILCFAMPARLLLPFATFFLVAFTGDAALSLLEEVVRHATGSRAILPVRNFLAWMVVLAALVVLPAMTLSPRLPPSVLAPPALFALWTVLGAAPLPAFGSGDRLSFALVGLQLAVVGLAFWRIRRLSGGRSFDLGATRSDAPAFSPAYSLKAAGILGVGGLALLAAYLPLWLMSSLQSLTDGFVRFDLQGVSLADRRFERDGQEVRLVGMMHIGEGDSYAALVQSFVGGSTVVLAEGVTDSEGLMEAPLSYEGVAQALGLDTQNEIEAYLGEPETEELTQWPVVHHADLDLSDFHPESVALLESIAGVWDGDDPRAALRELVRRHDEDPEQWAVFREDVLTRRNLHLLGQLREALTEYERVIVPWGALHQPFVQRQTLEMGFEPTSSAYHLLASWNTVLAALAETLARP